MPQASITVLPIPDEELDRINKQLNLGAENADQLRQSYDHLDLAYMVATGKEPPTAAQLAIAFGKYVHGLRSGDEGWCQLDTDALLYSTGQY